MAKEDLASAKKAKKDEFYTQLSDIEAELRHYKEHFKNKTILCNCDDPRVSNFFHYFSYNFEALGLKRLITTCYKSQERDLFSSRSYDQAISLIYDGDKNGNRRPDPEEIGIVRLEGDGDFRSKECIKLLEQAEKDVARLMADDDVTNKTGIYPYVLSGEEKHLHIRMFDNAIRRSVYEQQKHQCLACGKLFPLEEMDADHITPWSKGGQTTIENCQMLCKSCNRKKGAI